MKKLKLGFVGAGYMGQLAHIENYYKLSNVEMVALAEGRKTLAQRVAQIYEIAKVYSTHKELCKDKEVDTVVSIMYFSLNYGVVKDLLLAGKNVITEKPICVTSEGGKEIVQMEKFPDWMSKQQIDKLIWWLNFYSHQTNLIRYYLDEDYTF